ncbi:bifunctional [glutamate--ammonia ligase]-adenylyl-L-tyrosine phosphorylase/[glutamate--ammonia-ligase] adenylyltransferase [Glaciecola sp. SC05]|uniref:bifunctional [glutamate--ammonia ligase]-adenylyl-L-tyrosine phosphorylase/[glutamate--ammonia-ligase] adenylyltransferase n=1 Tax=Glaciecola sp. SC05 TaxID=1987355 RepID=UPI003529775E
MTSTHLATTSEAELAKDALIKVYSQIIADSSDKTELTMPSLPAELLLLLERVLPLSDFVCRVIQQFPHPMYELFVKITHDISLPKLKDYHNELSQALDGCSNEHDFHRVLRSFRQVEMACVAVFDLLKIQAIKASMASVSAIADAIIELAYLWIYDQQCIKYGTPERHQHMQIMAMGKLGGGELNFSSDIDMIFAYPTSGETRGAKRTIEHQAFFTKAAQKLIHALDFITEHGRCYRVDMRLRPMGDSGPLVMPYNAIESYYQEQGRAWERYAMQKMRIINVNSDTHALYKLIKPFVYRKYIDFTTLDAIREMKVLIEKEVHRRQLSQNIKLGQGGIREVEFFVQALQLIHAGREPRCKQVSTLKALDALHAYEFISQSVYDDLKDSYLYLRKIEHYLQIFDDEQTQILPQDPLNQTRLTSLLGFDSYPQCLVSIDACMAKINMHFRTIVKDANQADEDDSAQSEELSTYADVWNLNLDEQEVASLLSNKLSAPHSSILFKHLQSFKQKLQSASVSERGMRSINRLMPLLLSELHMKDMTLDQRQIEGIFGILLTITGRITYIDLLLENPSVRQRLNSLCRKSLWVAQEISQHPMLLDELLHPVYLKADGLSLAQWKSLCAEELKQYMLRVEPDDIEAVMDTLRQFKNAYQLRIAAADISGTIAINQVSDKLTLLGEVILAEVVEQAWRQVTLKHGVPQDKSHVDKGFGIVGYGKFGGIELSYGSDLDIVCLYDATKDGHTDSSGARDPISHQEFYIKLVQKIIHYCITKTYHGELYDIDLRLRPSGNSGLLITHINSFADYELSTAWTWEHQALVRGRLVIGTQSFAEAFEKIRVQTLCLARDSNKLLEDVSQMREKMRAHLNASNDAQIDIKQCEGGIVDIEFMVQFWVLNFASDYPGLARWSDNLRILDVCADINVIDTKSAKALQEHYLWLRHLAHRLQLSGRLLAQPSEKLDETRQLVSYLYKSIFAAGASENKP